MQRWIHLGRIARGRADELCARGRQAFFARLDGKPVDEDARERSAVLLERDAAGRNCFFADSNGALGEL